MKLSVKFYMVTILFLFSLKLQAQNDLITKANYELASRYSPAKLRKMAYSTTVNPHFMKYSNRFWYSYETNQGRSFYLVDPILKDKKPLFDNVKMAAMLTKLTKNPYDAQHLPITTVKFIKNDRAFTFEVEVDADQFKKPKKDSAKVLKDTTSLKKDTTGVKKGKKKETEKKTDEKKSDKKTLLIEYDLQTGKLSMNENYEKPKDRPKWASIAPDSSVIVFAKKNNLYFMDKANFLKAIKNEDDSTIVETQLTTDGVEYYGYGGDFGENNVDKEKNKDKRKGEYVIWSPDSKKFALIKSDDQKVKDLWVINTLTEPRPTLETYRYAMPGEAEQPQNELLVFDLPTKKSVKVRTDCFKDQSLSILPAPRLKKNMDDEFQPSFWLGEMNDKFYFYRNSRDLKRIDVCQADANTGEIKVLIEERLNTYIETKRLQILSKTKEMIHWSERDGWGHFYLYDNNGNLKNQITSGAFHCESILNVDETNRVLYFLACGREQNRDPYYMHVYRINLDGNGLQLLSRENAEHTVSMGDYPDYFVDNYSRIDTIPKCILKSPDGRPLIDLETSDFSQLLQVGFKFPETFKVKADDGVTDLYGVMYKPFDFDAKKKYPIITYVYPGPQTESVQKFSSLRDENVSLAQLGFVVVVFGNRGGHPNRSKWYHNYGYGDLRDYGLADKKTGIEQLTARYSYMDINRIGIYGHSGGGFMSTAAMLVYPDFFKAAVSSSGNHENNIYNRWWSETHNGVKEVQNDKGEISFKYNIEKNTELAKNLKGRLFLVTGEVDNNVHPGNTIRMANALIKANKRFDFFMFPGQRHGYGNMTEYFFWLRADYFAKYLIGDFASSVDMIELGRDKQQTGGR